MTSTVEPPPSRRIPPAFDKWYCRNYHGTPRHNSRGVVQRFLGFWDCNPTTLIPVPQAESAALFVEMMGGADKILAKGRELHDQGQYLLAQEILNKLVQAEPTNAAAKDLLAHVFEQVGYQQESPGVRNSFLAASYELRTGIPQGETADTSSPDVIRAMSTELFLNFLGIRMDSRKAEGMRFTINLVLPDIGEMFLVEMENATLTNIQGYQAKDADLTLTINRSDLELTMMGTKTLEHWDHLDFAAMAMGEARYGRFSIVGDVLYTKLSGSRGTPLGVLAESVDVDAETFAGFAGVGYSMLEDNRVRLDVVGGIRVWHVNTSVSVSGGSLGNQSRNDGDTWVDALGGLKGTYSFTPNLFVTGWGLVGGGGANIDWDVAATLGYKFNDTFSAVAGYRALGVDYSNDGFVFDVVQQGPILGLVVKF